MPGSNFNALPILLPSNALRGTVRLQLLSYASMTGSNCLRVATSQVVEIAVQ